MDTIGGDAACFQSKRLRYINPEKSCPFLFELLGIEGEISTFLFLTRSRWPERAVLSVQIEIEGAVHTENAAVLEGGMRLKLSQSAGQKIISALQQGIKVAIVVDGFKHHLRPDQFTSYFERFLGDKLQVNNFLKGAF